MPTLNYSRLLNFHIEGGKMPLKIETGTYTVNPVIKKEGGSKFSLWKHWRRRYAIKN